MGNCFYLAKYRGEVNEGLYMLYESKILEFKGIPPAYINKDVSFEFPFLSFKKSDIF
ncbi:hypothetical protein SAMN02983004_00845 [Borreliella japonica]|uniref:Uncharacterized protein n=1 Tax=Borreliella japonica TaxID=34095 RepID=A0A1G4PYC2_BORJA|nr:hypothetical protein [Borreliella japonica]WKC88644.1 hypothetical protein QIA20_00650 [Borreliella japonica]SCW37320.1 hypothetical protein SAMN02983004_00845 [Borreliella japonica]